MLASVPLGWLWLAAIGSLVLSSCLLGSWIPLRKFRIAYPAIMVALSAPLYLVCKIKGMDLSSMLVLYTSAHLALTIGILPQRKQFREVFDRWRNGEEHPDVTIPTWHMVFFGTSLVVVSLGGIVLTQI